MYKEKHHIIPRCLGGSDESTNLIALTPEKHLLAHYILAKLFPDNWGLQFAFYCMANTREVELTDKMMEFYGEKKREAAIVASLRMSKRVGKLNHQYGKRGILSPNYGRKLTKEQKEEISERFKGVPKTKEHRENLSKAKKGYRHSDKAKAKMTDGRRKGLGNSKADHNIYLFIHRQGETFTGTRFDFREKFHVRSQDISALKSGRQKTVKGWSCDFTPITLTSNQRKNG